MNDIQVDYGIIIAAIQGAAPAGGFINNAPPVLGQDGESPFDGG